MYPVSWFVGEFSAPTNSCLFLKTSNGAYMSKNVFKRKYFVETILAQFATSRIFFEKIGGDCFCMWDVCVEWHIPTHTAHCFCGIQPPCAYEVPCSSGASQRMTMETVNSRRTFSQLLQHDVTGCT